MLHAVLDAFMAFSRLDHCLQEYHALSKIIRMDELLEWFPFHLICRIAQKRGPGRGNKVEYPLSSECINNVVAVLDQVAVLLFALEQSLFHLLTLSDVGNEAVPKH